MIATFACFWTLPLITSRWLSFIASAVLSLGRSRTIAKHSGFRGFLWVGSSCWEEVVLFHCKNCAFSTSKPHYCQTHWFQRFFVGWLIMLGRGDSLSLQELCFHLGRSRTIAKHTSFGWFLWVGSSCWEEVALFHCKSCAFSRSKPHYFLTHRFQGFFVGWLIMLGRGDSLSLQELCFH